MVLVILGFVLFSTGVFVFGYVFGVCVSKYAISHHYKIQLIIKYFIHNYLLQICTS
jgi:hypothetical protein